MDLNVSFNDYTDLGVPLASSGVVFFGVALLRFLVALLRFLGLVDFLLTGLAAFFLAAGLFFVKGVVVAFLSATACMAFSAFLVLA